MKLFKINFLFIIMLLTCIFYSGCMLSDNSADAKLAKATEQLMTEVANQIGMPNITNFQQKKTLKMIYELCDKENLICYAYIKSDYQGKLFFIGKCIGYGIPFSAQYSNPKTYKRIQPVNKQGSGISWADMKMPQPEPNGLFMPTSSSATWLLMIDPKTKKSRPVYIEPEIVVSPFPLF